MSKVIHGIYTPLVTCLMMGNVSDSVDNGVAHIDVGRSHINLCAEGLFAVGKFACGHSCEKVKVFFNRAVTVGAVFAGLGKSASVFSDFVCGKVANVCLAVFDELDCAFINEIKVA